MPRKRDARETQELRALISSLRAIAGRANLSSQDAAAQAVSEAASLLVEATLTHNMAHNMDADRTTLHEELVSLICEDLYLNQTVFAILRMLKDQDNPD